MLVVALVAILAIGFVRSRNASRLQTVQPEISSQRTENVEDRAVGKESKLPKHKVIEGETLWSIAQMYYKSGYQWTLIAKVNNLTNPNLLVSGVTLTIPKGEAVAPADAISGSTYTVKENDTLWDIAVRAYSDGFRWEDIAKANALANPNLIHPGNVFKIPR